jgi:N-acyl-D-amino-acid deacylase
MANYSLIIKNGMVLDGTGGTMKRVDVGISGNKIKTIGDLEKENAETIIDAANKYVCPGFIDLTTHSDTHWTLFSFPVQESFIRQGVTTILGGHGGISLAPLIKAEDISGIGKWVDISKININWQSMDEFLSELSNHPLGVNFATLVGHNTLRRGVITGGARQANENEIKQIKFLIEKSLKEGAFGFSTNLGTAHEIPATNEELIEFLGIVKKFGAASFHHLSDEGQDILPALSRLILAARESGAKSHINHFKAVGKKVWPFFPRALEMIEQMRQENFYFTCDLFPYTQTGSNLYMLLPFWAREKDKRYIIELIKTKERKNLIAALKELTLHYEKIIVASTLHDLGVVGKSVLELSQSSGISPEETILDLLTVNELQVSIFNETISEENIETLLQKDYSAVASDGVGYDGTYSVKNDLPHPRSYGSFPRILRHYVKEKGILDWEKAVYKMTGLPAKIIGLKDRGMIKNGAYADIVVINPETIKDHASYTEPAQFSQGVEYVLVNGVIELSGNSLTSRLGGQPLRRT